MSVKEFVLALFEQGKQPEEIDEITPLKSLSDVHDFVTIYFVDREVGTVSELYIEKFYCMKCSLILRLLSRSI